MHTYVKDINGFAVVFNHDDHVMTVRIFKDERHAATYVHYLNGGDITITLEYLFSVSQGIK